MEQAVDRRSRLQVVATAGPAEEPRAVLAFESAMAAAAAGVEVALFLMLDASAWACAMRPAGTERGHAMLDQLLELGVSVNCCSNCASERCLAPALAAGRPPESKLPTSLREGIRICGLTGFVEGVALGIPTVTI